MRKALLTIAIAICITGSKAQNIQLFSESGAFVTGQSLSLTDGEELKIKVKNNSGQTKEVGINFREAILPDGSENSICWQFCFDNSRPGTDFGIVSIEAGQTNSTAFHCVYFSNGVVEPASFTFVFYDINNLNDSAQVILMYNPNSIEKNENSKLLVYPNPAKNNIYIDFQGQIAEIALRDITGRLIYNKSADKLMVNSIDLSNVPNGTYVVEVIALGEIYRQKIVVCKN